MLGDAKCIQLVRTKHVLRLFAVFTSCQPSFFHLEQISYISYEKLLLYTQYFPQLLSYRVALFILRLTLRQLMNASTELVRVSDSVI